MTHDTTDLDSNIPGIAFTSFNLTTGYAYGSLPFALPDRSSPTSISAGATLRQASLQMSRTTSSTSRNSNATAASSNLVDDDGDSDLGIVSSPRRCRGRQMCQPVPQQTDLIPGQTRGCSDASQISSPFTCPPITLLVGGLDSPTRESMPAVFYVHQDYLTSVSDFFRAAFENENGVEYTEGASRVMRMPEDRPQDWAYALQWIYSALSNPMSGLACLHSATSLWHEDVDVPLARYQEYRTMKRAEENRVMELQKPPMDASLKETEPADDNIITNSAENDVKQTISILTPTIKRPPSPAFGPLIRLYILADKYSLPVELKIDICKRVKEVGRLGKCIPDQGDVWNLWDSVLEPPNEAADKSTPEESKPQRSLKDTVLDMYRDLNVSSFGSLFFRYSAARSASLADEDDEDDEDDDVVCNKWHPVFMRDLTARMHHRLHDLNPTIPVK